MTVETIFYIIIGLTVAEFIFTKVLSYLNTLNWSDKLPKEVEWIYDEKKYKKSQQYEKAKFKFGTLWSIFSFVLMLLILLFGWFGWLDSFVRGYSENSIYMALIFFGIISLIQTIISLPSSYYSTFVIEQNFGFNKMTKALFFWDMLKSLVLSFVVWAIMLSAIVYIYMLSGAMFWVYASILIIGFSIFMMMFYSTLIVPIFNKQTPLESGELRDEIEKFAKKVWFKLDNIFVIDGSKRSSKANAYFSGIGSSKRIVLYDTLIKDLEIKELVAVLAHEIGHYKKKHTLQMLAVSVIQTLFMMFLLGLALSLPQISQALWAQQSSFHVGVIAFWILFTPISIILGILSSLMSRKNEYEADAYAKQHYEEKYLRSALIKLSKNNLSNLRPHSAYEFVYYSHPTTLKRLAALKK